MVKRDIEVLIVEDDLRIAEIQKRFIEQIEGFQTVGIAAGYVEAKTLIDILKPDLLLLDVYFSRYERIGIIKGNQTAVKTNGCYYDYCYKRN